MDRFARGLLEESDISAEERLGQSLQSNLRLSELGIERRISSTSRRRETDTPGADPKRQAEPQHERKPHGPRAATCVPGSTTGPASLDRV